VSLDTEEDNWRPARAGVTVENIRELPRISKCLERLGVRTTYFTTYQVAIQPWAAEILGEIRERGAAEIGAHLHPWNTPPLEEALLPHNSMLKNLPAPLQLAKLRELTMALTGAFGTAPTVFRAGRFGLGTEAVSALSTCGYQVDCSVTPFMSWEAFDDGPTFVGAPVGAYRVGVQRDVAEPQAGGPLVEIPVTCGYTRFSSAGWCTLHRILYTRRSRPSLVTGLASRLGLAKLALLSPEMTSVRDMLAVSRGALAGGVRHLQLMFHSPSLRPGLTPWNSTAAQVDRLYRSIGDYLTGLAQMASVRCATVGEARLALGFKGEETIATAAAQGP